MSRHSSRGPAWQATRLAVIERDGYACTRCGERVGPWEVHHLKPTSKGGTDDLDNLVTLCVGCHHDEHGRGHSPARDAWRRLLRARYG